MGWGRGYVRVKVVGINSLAVGQPNDIRKGMSGVHIEIFGGDVMRVMINSH